MQSGWRLYGVMILLAALTGTVVALALSGGPRFPSDGPRTSASPSASPSNSASRSPSSESSPTPTPTPSPSPTPSDPLLRVKPLVFAWRPADTTAVVEQDNGETHRIVAVPLDGTTAKPLLDIPKGTQWSIRRDGSAIALTLRIDDARGTRTRIAALNLQTGGLGWVTPDEPDVSQVTPWWSNDGTVVYYTRVSLDGSTDMGVYRVRPDGTNLTQLRAPSSDGPIAVTGLTPDGLGLVLSRAIVSGYIDILDLNTRQLRSFQTPATLNGERAGATVDSWRPQRPRALVSFGGPAGGAQLFLWDDLASPVSSPKPIVQGSVNGADWDPTATRIVVSLSLPNGSARLVTMDASGQGQTPLEGTDGASSPYWLRAGIVYLFASTTAPTSAGEVRLAQPAGTSAPKTLYRDIGLMRLTYVTP